MVTLRPRVQTFLNIEVPQVRLNSILWVATVAVVPNLTSCASIAPAPGPLVGEVEIAPSQDVKLEAVERPIARVLWSAPARQAIVVAGRPSNKYPDLGGLVAMPIT